MRILFILTVLLHSSPVWSKKDPSTSFPKELRDSIKELGDRIQNLNEGLGSPPPIKAQDSGLLPIKAQGSGLKELNSVNLSSKKAYITVIHKKALPGFLALVTEQWKKYSPDESQKPIVLEDEKYGDHVIVLLEKSFFIKIIKPYINKNRKEKDYELLFSALEDVNRPSLFEEKIEIKPQSIEEAFEEAIESFHLDIDISGVNYSASPNSNFGFFEAIVAPHFAIPSYKMSVRIVGGYTYFEFDDDDGKKGKVKRFHTGIDVYKNFLDYLRGGVHTEWGRSFSEDTAWTKNGVSLSLVYGGIKKIKKLSAYGNLTQELRVGHSYFYLNDRNFVTTNFNTSFDIYLEPLNAVLKPFYDEVVSFFGGNPEAKLWKYFLLSKGSNVNFRHELDYGQGEYLNNTMSVGLDLPIILGERKGKSRYLRLGFNYYWKINSSCGDRLLEEHCSNDKGVKVKVRIRF